jgi:hypothetical protein
MPPSTPLAPPPMSRVYRSCCCLQPSHPTSSTSLVPTAGSYTSSYIGEIERSSISPSNPRDTRGTSPTAAQVTWGLQLREHTCAPLGNLSCRCLGCEELQLQEHARAPLGNFSRRRPSSSTSADCTTSPIQLFM